MISLYTRRRLINIFALSLSMLAMAIGVAWLLWILYTVVAYGIEGISLQLFTEITPGPYEEGGGLANAIVGSLILVVLAMLVGTPIGVLAGVYLAEYGQEEIFGKVTLFINDILLSAPSIIIGLFVYALMVPTMGTYSGWAGVVALVLLMIPIVVRTTENMLVLIPNNLREAAYAIGAPKYSMILNVTIRSALSGVLTGVLLAVARIAGETAPLLFTALNSQFWSLDMNKPMANLPVTIYKFALSPYEDWQRLAWAGVFIITASVLFLNMLARSFVKEKRT